MESRKVPGKRQSLTQVSFYRDQYSTPVPCRSICRPASPARRGAPPQTEETGQAAPDFDPRAVCSVVKVSFNRYQDARGLPACLSRQVSLYRVCRAADGLAKHTFPRAWSHGGASDGPRQRENQGFQATLFSSPDLGVRLHRDRQCPTGLAVRFYRDQSQSGSCRTSPLDRHTRQTRPMHLTAVPNRVEVSFYRERYGFDPDSKPCISSPIRFCAEAAVFKVSFYRQGLPALQGLLPATGVWTMMEAGDVFPYGES